MNFIAAIDYQDMSEKALGVLLEDLDKVHNICLATGGSPEGLYKLFVDYVKKNNVNLDHIMFTKLDEWIGVTKDSEASCEKFLMDKVLKPLGKEKDYIGFDPEKDPNQEVVRIQEFLKEHPIDVCILGLGMNGHLGLNEPNSEGLNSSCHISQIQDKTKGHAMIKNEKGITSGMTLGMKDILNSKKIILLVSGDDKEEVFKALKQNIETPLVPATYLTRHNDVIVIYRADQFK